METHHGNHRSPRGAAGAEPTVKWHTNGSMAKAVHWLTVDSHSDADLVGTVRVPPGAGRLRTFLAYIGPGLLVAVGYMDPGNWATDIAGGAQFGYRLLSVVLLSSLVAMVLQYLAVKLGIATGHDLAQACRAEYPRRVVFTLWVLCEVAIVACDLAEVIGSAVALHLLFHLPLVVGVVLTAADVVVVLLLQNKGFRYIEALVGALIFVIAGCFVYELAASHPAWTGVLRGIVPTAEVVTNPAMLYLTVGIIGATVMPHNLYLHSSLVQTRNFERTERGKTGAIRFAALDSNLALFCAFFINAAILVLSAAAFHGTKHEGVADISDAYQLLSPVLGASLASTLFAVALLASGQNSTLTGTLAGQIVMEGFLEIRLRPWVRRLLTRLLAVVPAALVAGFAGESGVGRLLVLSQVVLSLQLSFAVFPLVAFTSNRRLMGSFANGWALKTAAYFLAIVIFGLNAYLVYDAVHAWLKG